MTPRRQKRRTRSARSLRRNRPSRSPYDIVLIVCEGAKTEPFYFKELRDYFKLNTANIHICGEECGSSPRDVVDYAIQKSKENDTFDRIYCVFDKDRHATYYDSVNRIQQLNQRRKAIFAVTSVPCFEFWLLLHFKYTTRSYYIDSYCGSSVCDKVIKELRQYLPNYKKGMSNIFEIIKDKLPDAITRANQILEYNRKAQTDDPSTNVHKLVLYLENLK